VEEEPDVLLEDLLQSALDTTKQDPEAAAGKFGRGGQELTGDDDTSDLPDVFQFPGEKARTPPERWRFPSTDETLHSDKRISDEEQTIPPANVFSHLDVPKDFQPILEAIETDSKSKVKLAKAAGGKSAGKLEGHKAIATVIKHKDRNGQGVAQTVLIPNNPEAHKAFGIKNVPRQFFDQMEKLIESGARPLSAKPKIERTHSLDDSEPFITTLLPHSDTDDENEGETAVVTPPVRPKQVKNNAADQFTSSGEATTLPGELLAHLVEQPRGAKAAAILTNSPEQEEEFGVSSASLVVGNDIVSEIYNQATSLPVTTSGSRVFFNPQVVDTSSQLASTGPKETSSQHNGVAGLGVKGAGIQFRGDNNIAPPPSLTQYNNNNQQQQQDVQLARQLQDVGVEISNIQDFARVEDLVGSTESTGEQLQQTETVSQSAGLSATFPQTQGESLDQSYDNLQTFSQDQSALTDQSGQSTYTTDQNSNGISANSFSTTGQNVYSSGQSGFTAGLNSNSFGQNGATRDQHSFGADFSDTQNSFPADQNSYNSGQSSFSNDQNSFGQSTLSTGQNSYNLGQSAQYQTTGISTYFTSQNNAVQSNHFSSDQNTGSHSSVLNTSPNFGENSGQDHVTNNQNDVYNVAQDAYSSSSSSGSENPSLTVAASSSASPAAKGRPASLWQQSAVVRKPEAVRAQEFARPDNPAPLQAQANAVEAIYKGLSTFQRQQPYSGGSSSGGGVDNSYLFTNPPMTFQTASGRFVPPSTLVFGFKPMTPTPATSLPSAEVRRPLANEHNNKEQGFNPPPKVNYGLFKPSSSSAAVYNQVSDDGNGKSSATAVKTSTAALSRPKASSSYSIIDQISDFLEPFTKPWTTLFASSTTSR
jgi:hypothetical protein